MYGQNLVNSSNAQRTNLANAYNRAFQGLQARNMMRAIYPMYDIDPTVGAYNFLEGMDFTDNLPTTTQPTASTGTLAQLVQKYKDELKGTLSPEELEKQAVALARDEMRYASQSNNISRRAYLQQNPMAALQGMTGGYSPFE